MKFEDAIPVLLVQEQCRQIADLRRRVRELESRHIGIVARGECPSDDAPDPFERLTSED